MYALVSSNTNLGTKMPKNDATITWKNDDATVKNCLESPILIFDIASKDGGRGLWSLISGDDVITGTGPDQQFFIDSDLLN